MLPANFPNLLANGSSGIAVGMATNIPPHNAGELCDAALHLIKFPNATADKLVDFVPGPGSPDRRHHRRAARVASSQAYKTGRGSIRLRARWTQEDTGRGTYQIVVTEIPYQVQKARLVGRIAELLQAKKLPLLADVRDEVDGRSAPGARAEEPHCRSDAAHGADVQADRARDAALAQHECAEPRPGAERARPQADPPRVARSPQGRAGAAAASTASPRSTTAWRCSTASSSSI